MIKAGSLGEIAVAKQLLIEGYEVYSSLTDNSTYDLIANKDNLLFRVEVKSTSIRTKYDTGWYVMVQKVRSNKTKNVIYSFDNSLVDILAIYIVPLDRVILLNSKEVTQKSGLVIYDRELVEDSETA